MSSDVCLLVVGIKASLSGWIPWSKKRLKMGEKEEKRWVTIWASVGIGHS